MYGTVSWQTNLFFVQIIHLLITIFPLYHELVILFALELNALICSKFMSFPLVNVYSSLEEFGDYQLVF